MNLLSSHNTIRDSNRSSVGAAGAGGTGPQVAEVAQGGSGLQQCLVVQQQGGGYRRCSSGRSYRCSSGRRCYRRCSRRWSLWWCHGRCAPPSMPAHFTKITCLIIRSTESSFGLFEVKNSCTSKPIIKTSPLNPLSLIEVSHLLHPAVQFQAQQYWHYLLEVIVVSSYL